MIRLCANELLLDGTGHGFHDRFRSGYEDRLAIHSMLGLREEIGGDKIGIRCLVRDHLYLGWSGGHIDGDFF